MFLKGMVASSRRAVSIACEKGYAFRKSAIQFCVHSAVLVSGAKCHISVLLRIISSGMWRRVFGLVFPDV